jgi:pyruvyltransferase
LGSILQWADANSIICGAGFMFSDARLKEMPKSIVCVRGPLTAAILEKHGVHVPKKYADPGVLAPAFFPDSSKIKYKIGIIPHRKDANNAWLKTNRKKGILVIDVLSPLKKYFRQMQQCEVILSSSLHGLIFAHAYGKPALWIELSDRVEGNGFKFYDYYQSLGLPPDKVRRIKIHEKTDPYEISGLAEFADQSMMREIMEESIEKTKTILFHDDQG